MLFFEKNANEIIENVRQNSAIYDLLPNILLSDTERTKLATPTEKRQHVEAFYELHRGFLEILHTNLCTDLLRYYCYVFLSGKHCESTKIRREITDIENYLLQFSPFDNLDETKIPRAYKAKYSRLVEYNNLLLYERLVKIFQRIKTLVLNFTTFFESSIILDQNNEIFSAYNNTHINLPDLESNYLDAFQHTLDLLSIEHFGFSPNDAQFREIILIKKSFGDLSLKTEEKTELKPLIDLKCDFLLYKIAKRRGKKKYKYILDSSKEEIFLDGIEQLKNWQNFIETHYFEGEEAKLAQRRRLGLLVEKDISCYEFEDFHCRVKLFKDDFKKSSEIEKLQEEVKKRKTEEPFDRYSLKILNSYIFNNLVSLKLENANLKYEELLDIYESVRSHQHTDNIKNYFPWLKLSQYLIKNIEDYSKQIFSNKLQYNSTKEYKAEYDKLLALLSKSFSKLKSASSWSLSRKFQPFQSCFKECQSQHVVNIIDMGEFNLFFPSSYVLPVNYIAVQEDIRAIEFSKNQIGSFDQTFSLLINIIEKMKSTNQELEDSKTLIKQQERRSIEVLGVFSAIALFSIGSIQIFKDNVEISTNTILNFILAFGFCLTLFIYLIWVITRENLGKVHWYHFLVITLYIVAFSLIYIQISNNEQKKTLSPISSQGIHKPIPPKIIKPSNKSQ